MGEKVILTSVSIEELVELLLKAVKREDERGVSLPEHDELLDRKEAAAFLRITLPTLREYTRLGILKGYRLGSRVRYKRSELMGALRPMDFGSDSVVRSLTRQARQRRLQGRRRTTPGE